MAEIKVVVAEDSNLLRSLLIHQLSQEPDIEVAGEARNGREAVDLAARIRPDVIVMDLDMPVLNGVQATERITSQQPYIKVILLTAHDGLASIGRISGAYASLNKGCTREELIAEIRRASTAGIRRSVDSNGAGDYSVATELLSVRGGLTDMEKSVLDAVIEAEMTLEQIAAALSTESDRPVTVSSVKHTLGRVMNKLRIEPRTRAALVKHVMEFARSRDNAPALTE